MGTAPKMLASDLDGTLIPPGSTPSLLAEVRRFAAAASERGIELTYATGRNFDLAIRGIDRVGLPLPGILVCDVGTSAHVRSIRSGGYVLDESYREIVREALGGVDRNSLLAHVGQHTGLELQEGAKQSEFKISYYVDPARLEALRDLVSARLAELEIPPKPVWSHDPYTGRMLLDLLPRGIAKHTALEHIRRIHGLVETDIVYAGDSGNDFDALLSGHPAVVVSNAPEALKRDLRERAASTHREARLYFARAPYAAGVVEGCRHFGAL